MCGDCFCVVVLSADLTLGLELDFDLIGGVVVGFRHGMNTSGDPVFTASCAGHAPQALLSKKSSPDAKRSRQAGGVAWREKSEQWERRDRRVPIGALNAVDAGRDSATTWPNSATTMSVTP
jgi:hypothetical protein